MNPSVWPASPDTADYTGVVRRRWKLVLAVTAVCLVGAVAYIEVAPKEFTATAAVSVVATGDQGAGSQVTGARTGTPVDLDTEAQLVTSGTVATIAKTALKSPLTPYMLSKQVSVAVPPNTQILSISCTAGTANTAADCANDFAKAYLSNRQTTAATKIAGQSKALTSQVSSLQKSVSSLLTTIGTLPSNSSTRLADQAQVNDDKTLITNLQDQISALTGEATNVSGGHVITDATPPGKPAAPDKTLVLPSGLVAGLVLGLIGAFVWDRRDKRLHGADDVERLLDIPVMLDLPRGTFGRQVSLASPRSRAGKAFTELAHTMAASLGEGSHIVLVAGATPGPEGSVVAANLAATLARTHSEAVLVCADLRDSVAPELFGLAADSRGLAEVVAGRATVGEVARGPAGVPGLWVIPPGADTSLAEYHLQHDTAKALTTQLRRDARYVIIEAQATDDGADTFALAEFADAAVLTIDAGRTSRGEAGSCIRRLHRMRTPILGSAVLAPLPPRFSVRPPQPGQARLGAGGRDEAVGGRAHGELSGTPPTSPSPHTGPDRLARSRDGHGDPADRISGR